MKPMRTPAIVSCTAEKCAEGKLINVDPGCVDCPMAKINFVDLEDKSLAIKTAKNIKKKSKIGG